MHGDSAGAGYKVRLSCVNSHIRKTLDVPFLDNRIRCPQLVEQQAPDGMLGLRGQLDVHMACSASCMMSHQLHGAAAAQRSLLSSMPVTDQWPRRA